MWKVQTKLVNPQNGEFEFRAKTARYATLICFEAYATFLSVSLPVESYQQQIMAEKKEEEYSEPKSIGPVSVNKLLFTDLVFSFFLKLSLSRILSAYGTNFKLHLWYFWD